MANQAISNAGGDATAPRLSLAFRIAKLFRKTIEAIFDPEG